MTQIAFEMSTINVLEVYNSATCFTVCSWRIICGNEGKAMEMKCTRDNATENSSTVSFMLV